jgi:hypothetical protein
MERTVENLRELDLRFTIIPDPDPSPAYMAMWRRLLSTPVPPSIFAPDAVSQKMMRPRQKTVRKAGVA